MAYSHTLAWDAANPLDTENAGLGASRIRDFKDMIQDRMQVGHIWGNSQTTDGEHKYDKIENLGSVSGTVNIYLTNGYIKFMKLSGNVTLSISDTDHMSANYARAFMLAVQQHSSSVYALTFPPSFKFHNNITINVTTRASWVTIYHCLSIDNGTHWIITHVGDFLW